MLVSVYMKNRYKNLDIFLYGQKTVFKWNTLLIEKALSLSKDNILSMSLTIQNIQTIKDYFSNKPVLKAYLFGSQVRGDAHANSDIDLLVELDYSQRIGLLFVKMQIELSELLNKKVDLVSANGLSKYIKPTIEKEKKLIYAR